MASRTFARASRLQPPFARGGDDRRRHEMLRRLFDGGGDAKRLVGVPSGCGLDLDELRAADRQRARLALLGLIRRLERGASGRTQLSV